MTPDGGSPNLSPHGDDCHVARCPLCGSERVAADEGRVACANRECEAFAVAVADEQEQTARARRRRALPEVPWIVADFELVDTTFLVVLWPADHGERWQVYQADFPWYWKSQPYEDRRV